MKQLAGLALFMLGVGMAVMVFAPVNFWTVGVISGVLILGYNLFCK